MNIVICVILFELRCKIVEKLLFYIGHKEYIICRKVVNINIVFIYINDCKIDNVFEVMIILLP